MYDRFFDQPILACSNLITLLLNSPVFHFLIFLLPIYSFSNSLTYQIKPNDQLQIVVVGSPDFNQTVTVQPDGKVSYFGGDIMVVGQGKADLLIRDHLIRLGLLKNPVVMVAPILKENEIYVGGNVKNPGRYSIGIEDKTDLYRAIALGGGTLINSDLESVILIHKGKLSYHDFTEHDREKILVRSGDLVYVPLLERAEVQGEVQNPGPVFFRQQIRIDQALAKSGGPIHDKADLHNCIIMRQNGKIETISATEKFWQGLPLSDDGTGSVYLLPNDVLYIPNAFKIEPIYVLGRVNQPGPKLVRVTFEDNRAQVSVRQAISLAGGIDQYANRRKVLVYRKEGKTEMYDLRNQSSGQIWLYPGDTVEIPARFQVNWSQVLSFISVTTLIINMINN